MSNIRADTLSTLDGTKSITTDRVTQGVARAWVNFNGTGTVAIRASFNVSSITDNGVGDYIVNFATAMPDANYSAVYSRMNESSSFPGGGFFTVATYQSTGFRFTPNRTTGGDNIDSSILTVAVFR